VYRARRRGSENHGFVVPSISAPAKGDESTSTSRRLPLAMADHFARTASCGEPTCETTIGCIKEARGRKSMSLATSDKRFDFSTDPGGALEGRSCASDCTWAPAECCRRLHKPKGGADDGSLNSSSYVVAAIQSRRHLPSVAFAAVRFLPA
jgi:hypothetical protein